MVYKVIITGRAEELLEELVNYLLSKFKSIQAASHLLDAIEYIYERVAENPFQFPPCKDSVLKAKGYRDAVLSDMNYTVILKVNETEHRVYVMGIFHTLENYAEKL